jgi:hypothetical protein
MLFLLSETVILDREAEIKLHGGKIEWILMQLIF